MPDLAPRSGLETVFAAPAAPPAGAPGVTLSLWPDLALASVIARKNQDAALAARVRALFNCDLPHRPQRVAGHGIAFLCTGPGQWLAMAQARDGHALEEDLREKLGPAASVGDQSDGRLVIRVAGPQARAAIQKIVPVDLHPRAFGPGDAAVTLVSHIGVTLWQTDETPAYAFAVPRSYAQAFWRGLQEAGAEFGVARAG